MTSLNGTAQRNTPPSRGGLVATENDGDASFRKPSVNEADVLNAGITKADGAPKRNTERPHKAREKLPACMHRLPRATNLITGLSTYKTNPTLRMTKKEKVKPYTPDFPPNKPFPPLPIPPAHRARVRGVEWSGC
jgi:hypothetical protein